MNAYPPAEPQRTNETFASWLSGRLQIAASSYLMCTEISFATLTEHRSQAKDPDSFSLGRIGCHGIDQ